MDMLRHGNTTESETVVQLPSVKGSSAASHRFPMAANVLVEAAAVMAARCSLPRGDELMASFTNEAAWDRALRIVVGLILLYLGWAGVVGGTVGVVFKFLGFLPLVTGVVGFCPAYALFGVSTCPRAPRAGPTDRVSVQ
jgi:hypothetical protein